MVIHRRNGIQTVLIRSLGGKGQISIPLGIAKISPDQNIPPRIHPTGTKEPFLPARFHLSQMDLKLTAKDPARSSPPIT
jgi:hypothetical protein